VMEFHVSQRFTFDLLLTVSCSPVCDCRECNASI
jgi:hypothetical protein